MDVDKLFREAVRADSHRKLQEVTYTSSLDERIRAGLSQRKKRGKSGIFTVAAAALCSVIILSLHPPLIGFVHDVLHHTQTGARNEQPDNQHASSHNQITGTEREKMIKEVMEKLTIALPELQQYQTDSVQERANGLFVRLVTANSEYAHIIINKESETLEWLRLEGEHPPGELPRETAETKAKAFLTTLLGEEADRYQVFQSFGLNWVVLNENGNSEEQVINVAFSETDENVSRLSGNISVDVDSSGRVVAYHRLNQGELSTIHRISPEIPDMQDYVLESKEAHDDGYTIVLRNSKEPVNRLIFTVAGEQNELIHFQRKAPLSQNNHISASDTWEKASEFLRLVLGDKSNHYKKIPDEPGSFQRYVNNIPVVEDRISIQVSSDGKVYSYRKGMSDAGKAADPE